MFQIKNIIPGIPRLKIVDVGASFIETEEPYSPLLRTLECDIVGFEPVEKELAKLQQNASSNQTYLPYVVGDGSDGMFHQCNETVTSSLFEPDQETMDLFQMLGEFTKVVERTPVSTKRLDDIPEVLGTDYLKLDVQGAELMVLKGAEKLLQGISVIHTEVEFVPLYRNQPLFAEIDSFLRTQGFLFHRFTGVSGRTFKPLYDRRNGAAALSQSLWADAVFVKDFRAFDQLEPSLLVKLAAILHENYRSLDLAALALKAHDKVVGTDFASAYLGGFSSPPQPGQA